MTSPSLISMKLSLLGSWQALTAGGLMDTTMETLTDIFINIFDNPDISLSPETTANDVDGWDSFSHTLLIMAIESRFKLTFTQKEIFNFKNVGDIAACINGKL
jgi:acyl carrier protein